MAQTVQIWVFSYFCHQISTFVWAQERHQLLRILRTDGNLRSFLCSWMHFIYILWRHTHLQKYHAHIIIPGYCDGFMISKSATVRMFQYGLWHVSILSALASPEVCSEFSSSIIGHLNSVVANIISFTHVDSNHSLTDFEYNLQFTGFHRT